MTVSTALKELEKRLSEASGPDREIDFRIAALTDEQMAADLRVADGLTYSSNGEFVLTFKSPAGKLGRGFYGNHMVPQFTHSLDAAVSLCARVLPGWWWTCGKCNLNAHASVGPDRDGPEAHLLSDPVFDAGFDADMEHGVPALALCLAVVRALMEREPT